MQDETGGFTAFIPWTFQRENTALGRKITEEPTGIDYLKMVSVSRLFLDNIQHIQSSWLTQGLKLGQTALRFGADDMGSIMIEENVVSAAGANNEANEKELRYQISEAGFRPQQRDILYKYVNRENGRKFGRAKINAAQTIERCICRLSNLFSHLFNKMISLIEALNFRSLRYINQPLSNFHVLVGPNASGKTTFLDVVAFLGKFVTDGLDAAIEQRTQNIQDLFWARKGDKFELAIEAIIPKEVLSQFSNGSYDRIRYEVAIGYESKLRKYCFMMKN